MSYAKAPGGTVTAFSTLLGQPPSGVPGCEAAWKDAQYTRLYLRLGTQATAGMVSVADAPAWLQAYFAPGTDGYPSVPVEAVNARAMAKDAAAQAALQRCADTCMGEAAPRCAARARTPELPVCY
jgi:hypothetical protein